MGWAAGKYNIATGHLNLEKATPTGSPTTPCLFALPRRPMAKREQFRLPGGTPIETGIDWNGRWFVGYRKGSSLSLIHI